MAAPLRKPLSDKFKIIHGEGRDVKIIFRIVAIDDEGGNA